MKRYIFTEIRYYLAGVFLFTLFVGACSKMDSTYRDFIHGSIIYVGSADSVKAHAGNNRLILSWLTSDPSAIEAKIYWNNRSDSILAPLNIKGNEDTVYVEISNLPEGTYSFEIYLFDDEGNRSVQSTVVGEVYGQDYISTQLQRPIRSALFNNDTITINWGVPDEDVIGTEVRYVDADNQKHIVFAPVDSMYTLLKNFDYSARDTFSYRTLYLPDSLAVDTFYLAYQTAQIIGPPVEYSREDWTAPAEDYDVSSGRVPQNVLDGSTSTVWHMDKTHSYPHYINIDMHTQNEVYGFTFIQRTPLDGAAQLIEIEISSDSENWESLGSFTLENNGNKQFVELLAPVTFRYYKVTFKSDYKNGDFTAIAEMGAYER